MMKRFLKYVTKPRYNHVEHIGMFMYGMLAAEGAFWAGIGIVFCMALIGQLLGTLSKDEEKPDANPNH